MPPQAVDLVTLVVAVAVTTGAIKGIPGPCYACLCKAQVATAAITTRLPLPRVLAGVLPLPRVLARVPPLLRVLAGVPPLLEVVPLGGLRNARLPWSLLRVVPRMLLGVPRALEVVPLGVPRNLRVDRVRAPPRVEARGASGMKVSSS